MVHEAIRQTRPATDLSCRREPPLRRLRRYLKPKVWLAQDDEIKGRELLKEIEKKRSVVRRSIIHDDDLETLIALPLEMFKAHGKDGCPIES